MVRYQLALTPAASRQLEALPRDAQERIDVKINGLRTNPRPPGVRKLRGPDSLYRIRVGPFRVVYSIHDERLVVVVIRIGRRDHIYD
ncbi:MAG: type II toxin-antitoxin system RelE/ParE family toxin [Candidatus Rokubacteria bacterium]|nr:type II toxin-antitoxin system RelE/ParE family toxin [Candidatus Rokubacteria bacterium]